jgi:hypothetical protein
LSPCLGDRNEAAAAYRTDYPIRLGAGIASQIPIAMDGIPSRRDESLTTAVDELTQERVARNDARFREANERIMERADELGVDEIEIPVICECADRDCKTVIRMSPRAFEEVRSNSRHFLNAPGHQVAALGTAEVVEHRSGYVIVEKQGHAGAVAERLDVRERANERSADSA